jgi:hypothetical protein
LYKNFLICVFGIVFTISIAGCNSQSVNKNESYGEQKVSVGPPLFQLLPADSTQIDFINRVTEGPNTNVLLYEYFYNGGGVAVGDLNGDGLQDIYFVGNMATNKLYLNKGHMHFQNITTQDIAGRRGPWKTGVTMADVNGDGKLDIYLCY